MVTIKQRNTNFYTEDGLKALVARAENIADLINKDDFPFSGYVLGFGKMEILDRNEALAKLQELSELTGILYEIKRIAEKDSEGRIKSKIEVII